MVWLPRWGCDGMITSAQKLLMARAGVQSGLSVSDIFSTALYTGNGSSQTSSNGIDVSSEGGLVWIKSRSSTQDNALFDTDRGASVYLVSNRYGASDTTDVNSLTSFGTSGFNVGSSSLVNENGASYASWTFRKAPSFFDVVTYTGTGTATTVPHNLGVAPKLIIAKRRSAEAGSSWFVGGFSYTGGVGWGSGVLLNDDTFVGWSGPIFNSTAPSDSVFSVSSSLNLSGEPYVAYLFADANLIKCHFYTGNGSASGPSVSLGWQPQFLMVKRFTGGSGKWHIYDSKRDVSNPRSTTLSPNLNSIEDTAAPDIDFTATGFTVKSSDSSVNASGSQFMYLAVKGE